MERMYKNLFAGIGVYGPEKFIYNAFSDEKPRLQELTALFVSAENEKRDRCLYRAAKAFVQGTYEKVGRKKLCMTEHDLNKHYRCEKYISLPDMMPHFSEQIKGILVKEPYNINEKLITMNTGETLFHLTRSYLMFHIQFLTVRMRCLNHMFRLMPIRDFISIRIMTMQRSANVNSIVRFE